MKSRSLVTTYPLRAPCRRHAASRAVSVCLLLGLSVVWTLQAQTPSSNLSAPPNRQALRHNIPAAVTRLKPLRQLAATNRLNLAIGLPLRNREVLTNLLRQLYDPASSNYRHYLTPAQFTEMFGPSEQDYQAVIHFAEAHGLSVTTTYSNRTLLDVSGSVGNIERALHVTMEVYQHPTENRTFYAPNTEPSLDLSTPVLHVSGLDNYYPRKPLLAKSPSSPNAKLSPAQTGSGPGGNFVGDDFRKAYVPGVTLTGTGQSVGLLEFDSYYSNDIALYLSQTGLPSVPLENVYVDAAYVPPSFNNSEVALDIDMAICMAPGLSKIVVYQAPLIAPWEDLLNRMVQDVDVKQFSSSWGGGSLNPNANADQIFQQMAAQGQSFFQASGDSCAYVDYIPFPSDNPFITVVGGTTLTTDTLGAWKSETVWNWINKYGPIADGIGSSGGISSVYSIPDYQRGVDMSLNDGSTTMRNLPDVALTADDIYIVADNGFPYQGVGGTSAAAPLWAAFNALVNEAAEANGAPPVGFVNPAIYAIGKGSPTEYTAEFHDTISGNNEWSGSPALFSAVAGYDLCTGWGTPAGQALIDALAGTVPPSGLLQVKADPPSGANLIAGSSQPVYVTVSDVRNVTNATVIASIPGIGNLTLMDDGQPPDVTTNDGVYSGTLQVPSSPGSITMTVTAAATNEIGATNVFSYNIIAAPSNDNFADAIKVPAAGASYLSNNRFATMEPHEPKHAGDPSAAASLWWDWTASDNTNVFVDTTGSAIDTVLAVYTGTALTNLTAVASANNGGLSQQAYLTFNSTPGTTYHIAVAGAGGSALGSIRFKVALGGQPDTYAPTVLVSSPLNGQWLTNSYVVLSGSTLDPLPVASGVNQVAVTVNSKWRFFAAGPTFDNWTCPAVLEPGLNHLQVTAQDADGNLSTPVNLQLTYVLPPAVPNDLFAAAIPLVLTNDAGSVSANTTQATKEFGEPSHAGNAGGKSVWWSFQPPADGLLRLSTSTSTFDTLLGVYTGPNVSHLTTIANNDDAYSGAPGGYSLLDMAVRSNLTYYVAVDGYNGASGTANLAYTFAATPVYHLTVSNTLGGSVLVTTTNSQGGSQVMPGTAGDFTLDSTVTLTGIPYAYYVFDHWDGALASTDNPLSVTVTNDLAFTGYFTPTPYTDGFESGTLSHLGWITAGDAPWIVQTNTVAAGQYAARSGVIGDSQSSSLILTTNFAAGFASFDYRVSSETNFDFLDFSVDGNLLHRWSGEVGWTTFAFPMNGGVHTLEWTYVKDPSLSFGLDAAFIDNLNLPIGVGIDNSTPAQLQMVNQGENFFVIHLQGQTNQQYVLQTSTNLLEWQSIATNTATDGTIQFPYPGSLSNSAHFYRAVAAPQ